MQLQFYYYKENIRPTEYDDIHEKRTNLEKTVNELQNAKLLIQSIM